MTEHEILNVVTLHGYLLGFKAPASSFNEPENVQARNQLIESIKFIKNIVQVGNIITIQEDHLLEFHTFDLGYY